MIDVVTYTEAHRHVEWNLCQRHASDEAADLRRDRGIGPLGRVLRGATPGRCAACETEKMK